MATIELVDHVADGQRYHGAELDNDRIAANGFGVQTHTISATVTGTDLNITMPALTDVRVPNGSGGVVFVSPSGVAVSFSSNSGNFARTDILCVNDAGSYQVVEGTPAEETGTRAEAPEPALPTDAVMVAKVRFEAGATVIGTDKVFGRAIDVSEAWIGNRKGTDIVAASTITLPATSEDEFDITGNTGITAISARPAGSQVTFHFTGTPTITHNGTSLILQDAADFTAAAGDVLVFLSDDGTNWREVNRHLATAGPSRLGAAAQAMVEGGRASFFFIGTSNIGGTDQAVVGIGGMEVEKGTGTVSLTSHAQMPAGNKLFVTANGDDGGHFASGNNAAAADDWVIGVRVKQNGSAAGQEFFIGLRSSANTFNDENDSLGFRLIDTGNYIGFTDDGGAETTRDSSNNDTNEHTLRMEISGGGTSISFYFDDTLLGAVVTTNIPAGTGLYIACGVTGTDAANHDFFTADFYGFRGN